MESNNECFVCGGHDFVIADGAFICNECGIQSQNVREELINFNDNNMHGRRDDMFDKDHEITAGSQLEKNKKLLSWECFNLILIGLTNEMIELGAKPSLKVIVLQLWVRYLQCIEAAFTSKKCRKLPKLNTSFNNIDGEILYDIENLRKKLLYSKTGIWKGRQKPKKSNSRKSLTSCNSNANSTMTASQKQIRITHKLRRLDHSKTDINNDSTGFSNDVNLLQRKKNSRKINIKMSKNVQKSLKGMPSITKDLTFEESAKLFQSGRKCWDLLKHKEKKNMITMKKLISIIRIATMINNDDIYLSDIIRWIYEGHFPINRINLFLPENVVHGIGLRKFMLMSSRNQLNLEMTMLLIHFKADQLPNIDFKKMAVRFCDELQLPSDFTNFVCKLVSISPPSLCFTCVSPDTEIEVMAYLLFAAKFLFCLDGNAENLSSDFAEKVNRLNKKHHKLFSWNEYVKYIECRNTVVSDYNSVLHTKLYENKIHNTKLFIDNWNIIKSTLPLKDKTLSKKFRENTECLFKSLPDVGRNESYRAIPASTKPLSSTLKWILDYYPMQLSVVTKTTLEKNFTQTDILYLTNKERICDLANKYDIPIEINCNKPLYYQKQKKNSDTKLSLPNNTQVNVCLREQSTKQIQQTETFNTSYKEKPNTIYLGTGLYYWYIHFDKFFLRRADIVKINMVFKKKLPHSFYWFMHQCCRILDCAQSCLYLELLKLEKKFSVTLQSYDTSSDSEDEDSLSGRSESS